MLKPKPRIRVYLVERQNDLGHSGRRTIFFMEAEANAYALNKAHLEDPMSNWEWKVTPVLAYESWLDATVEEWEVES